MLSLSCHAPRLFGTHHAAIALNRRICRIHEFVIKLYNRQFALRAVSRQNVLVMASRQLDIEYVENAMNAGGNLRRYFRNALSVFVTIRFTLSIYIDQSMFLMVRFRLGTELEVNRKPFLICLICHPNLSLKTCKDCRK